jgi:single-stranded-DNA-specific exonuclease
LTGENRVFAHFGLKVLRKSPRRGLNELLAILRVNRHELTEDDVGFSISPRINAASRMGQPMDAFRLFATTDDTEAATLARHLDKINNERKGKVASLVREARSIVARRHEANVPCVVVAGSPHWRPALLGLVANSLVEDYQKPVFVWGKDGGNTLKGSCRSDGSVDVTVMMQEARQTLLEFGGHAAAGGFSVALERVHLLEEELERAYEKVRAASATADAALVDAKLSLDEVNPTLWGQIEKLAPFGVGNPKPLFLFEQVEIKKAEQFGKEKQHLKLVFEKKNGNRVSAIHFFAKPADFSTLVQAGNRVNLLANLEHSLFGNRPELRLRIVDVC